MTNLTGMANTLDNHLQYAKARRTHKGERTNVLFLPLSSRLSLIMKKRKKITKLFINAVQNYTKERKSI